ncbi:hypothetical protein UA08_08046 [Talaromyces atroroseus]|uniref:Acyl-CoA synthetase YngI n=1 Tax=Talaromyces atroroseus TaxID=1441469 RepID=A0A225ASW8_TALAT|nr:hypothetical protein UA08_08046 [Talaromyces atroroseus]OKL56547.1 hypothetical protein UA08_08046 [Talaromyces atroroseus]
MSQSSTIVEAQVLLLAQDRVLEPVKDQSSAFEGPSLPSLLDIHLGKLLEEQSLKYSEKKAVISPWQQSSLTFKTLYNSTRDIAHRLLAYGVRPKDRVVVLAGNTLEYTELFFAVGGIGAIFSIINPTFTADEVANAVQFLDPAAIFIADRIGYRNNKALLNILSKERENQPLVVQMGTAAKFNGNVATWKEFLYGASNSAIEPDLLQRYWGQGDADDGLCIQFTSGTTGPRKAALVTHRNLLNNALLVGARLSFTSDDTVLCCSPIFHCFGLVCGVLTAIVYGGSVVLPSDVFIAESSIRALAEQKCTVVHAVPTMFQAMLDHPQVRKYSPEFCLRTGIIAGSSLSRTLLSRLDIEFKLNGLAYGFGMTECSCIHFMTDPSETSLLSDHISVGTVMPHTAAKVVDSELRDLPPGSSGELLISGYLVFKEYFKNPEKTAESFHKDSEGRVWLRTGDLVTLSTTGRCTVIGRVKDMIKRGGENIFPSDIEKLLESDPSIAAAAVVGIPDPDWGEVVGAFVKSIPGVKSDFEVRRKRIKLQLRTQIAPHKIPEHFFWIGEQEGVPGEIPINATGKIVKKDLRDIASHLLRKSSGS